MPDGGRRFIPGHLEVVVREVGSGLEKNIEVSSGLWALSRATSENNDRILSGVYFPFPP